MGRWIKSYPVLAGVFIAATIFCLIVVIVNWFPRVDNAWVRNNDPVRSILCTAVFFVYCIWRFWPLRRRRFFWLSILGFFFLHTLGVMCYSLQVHQLSVGQWMLLLGIEMIALLSYFDWLDRSSRHIDDRRGQTGRL